tara:strand:- start:783 stop:956 length:174 start_codon:yes stop_codon:yes gene_type:complete
MFYKYEEEVKEWQTGNKISFPDGTTLSVDNKGEKDGWFWSDEPPTEYTEWLEQQENI